MNGPHGSIALKQDDPPGRVKQHGHRPTRRSGQPKCNRRTSCAASLASKQNQEERYTSGINPEARIAQPTLPFHLEGVDGFAAGGGAEAAPGGQVDVVGDEARGAVAVGRVDADGMPAAGGD